MITPDDPNDSNFCLKYLDCFGFSFEGIVVGTDKTQKVFKKINFHVLYSIYKFSATKMAIYEGLVAMICQENYLLPKNRRWAGVSCFLRSSFCKLFDHQVALKFFLEPSTQFKRMPDVTEI